MMVSYKVTEKAVAKLDALVGSLGRAWHMALGKRARKVMQEHFLVKNKGPFKVDKFPDMEGRKRQNFWSQIAKNTLMGEVTDTMAHIVMDRRLYKRVHGGVIPAKGKKLAIPVTAKAYGIWPSSGLIPGLFLMVNAKSGAWLGKDDGKGGVDLYYHLLSSVKINRDPDALPSEAVMVSELNDETAKFINSKLK